MPVFEALINPGRIQSELSINRPRVSSCWPEPAAPQRRSASEAKINTGRGFVYDSASGATAPKSAGQPAQSQPCDTIGFRATQGSAAP